MHLFLGICRQTRRRLPNLEQLSIMEQVNMTAVSVLNSSITVGSASPGGTHHTVLWILLILGLVLLACIPGALQCLGFAARGVVAGSFAALWQSSIAIANGVGVVAGSLFAILQSIAMGGFMCAFAWLYVVIALAVVAALVSIFARRDGIAAWFEAGFEHVHAFVVHAWKEILQWVNVSEWWEKVGSSTTSAIHVMNACTGRKCLP